MTKVFITSQNHGPDYRSAAGTTMLYLGTSESLAREAVGENRRYKRGRDKWPENANHYSALPANMDQEMVEFYLADGWWWSIVMIDI